MSTYEYKPEKKRKSRLVYLDHAATSFPKPREVISAVTHCLTRAGGNPGRSSHSLALSAAKEVFACRQVAGEMFGASPDRVILTSGATHAINLAVKGLIPNGLQKKPHVLCSDMEHNAVYRPLCRLRDEGRITLDVFDTLPGSPHRTTEAILDAVRRRLRPETAMVVCAHTSNICSATLPVKEIGALCHALGIYFVVDAAQSAGHVPIHMEEMHVDALCLPGHKGLLGPMGVGMLLLGQDVTLDTLLEGGNGVDSLGAGMGDDTPERYEAGTLPTPCIAGLRAGMEHLARIGLETVWTRECALGRYLTDALSAMPHVRVYAPDHAGGTVLFSVNGLTSEAAGRHLDSLGFCLRPGFHCSALGHTTLGTPEGGALRVSFGYTNTQKDAESLAEAINAMRG